MTVVALGADGAAFAGGGEQLAKEGISVEVIDPRTCLAAGHADDPRLGRQDGPAADRGRGVRARSASGPRSPRRSPTAASTTSTPRSAG